MKSYYTHMLAKTQPKTNNKKFSYALTQKIIIKQIIIYACKMYSQY